MIVAGVVLTQWQRVTDRQTDGGFTIANTARQHSKLYVLTRCKNQYDRHSQRQLRFLNRELLTRWTLTRFDPRSKCCMTHWPVKWSAAEISVSVSAGTYRMNSLYFAHVCIIGYACEVLTALSVLLVHACMPEGKCHGPVILLFMSIPLSYIIHHRTDCRLFYCKKCLFSDNVLLQTLQAIWCYDNIFSLCDVYKFTITNLVDLPINIVYSVKELFWKRVRAFT